MEEVDALEMKVKWSSKPWPENDVFRFVKNHSFDEFYQSEIGIRKLCEVSPFQKMMMIYLTSKFQDKIREESLRYVSAINELIGKNFKDVEVLGQDLRL